MNEALAPFGLYPFRQSKGKHTPDYKQKLERGAPPSALSGPPADPEGGALPSGAPCLEPLAGLRRHPEVGCAAFQCVAVAALQALGRVLHLERQAAGASISLAQREKLHRMTGAVEAAAQALQGLLTVQGAKMLGLKRSAEAAPETLWWFALSEAIHAVESSLDRMHSLVAAQPEGSPVHTLSHAVAGLLRQHYAELFAEAEHWIA